MSFLYANPYRKISRLALVSPNKCRNLMMSHFEKGEHNQYLLCCFVLYYEHNVVEGLYHFVSYFFAGNNQMTNESDALYICEILEAHGVLEAYGEAGI